MELVDARSGAEISHHEPHRNWGKGVTVQLDESLFSKWESDPVCSTPNSGPSSLL
ncbi:hypothetical protein TTRE_0000963501 [Trichuris trichiura]|uniref:Uncharacterized protein n=1 Tax=Trichuris trichiura TaxID=36087 RepID=A0A077ZN38_TRITR|nr:hypothetical protein TTRE_0000963501 [Trichuris trichiura]